MATIISLSAVSEAEFGCEHLAIALLKNDPDKKKFQDSYLIAKQDSVKRPSSKFSISTLLSPAYRCLDCSEEYSSCDRKKHSKNTEHNFYMDSRTKSLYCQACGDFVYDYDLERLCRSHDGSIISMTKRRTLSESSSEELYVRTNANKRPCAKEGVRGLYNLGQTCYLNVILQTMLHDPLLSTYFLGNGHQTYDCLIPDCVGCAVSEAFADFNSREKTEGFAALSLLLASWKSSSILAGYQQQDAHEYYQFLVDKLHASTEDHSESPDRSCSCFFHKAFYGKLRSSVTCDRCGNITRTEDPIVDLSLDVQVQAKKRQLDGRGSSTPPTLNGCLESFTSPEKLMADVYNCSGCGNTPQKATKQLRIKNLPAILCMQLKRFEHTFSISEKVEGKIDFPMSINMLPYTTKSHKKDTVDQSRYWYDLASAVVHKGKLDAGHYYVYCRQGDQWMLFNDDQVTAVSEADVLLADAYLLFYTLRSFS